MDLGPWYCGFWISHLVQKCCW